MNDPWSELKFSEYESRLKTLIDDLGIGGIITVLPDPDCPGDKVFVMDTAAMEASTQQTIQRRRLFGWT